MSENSVKELFVNVIGVGELDLNFVTRPVDETQDEIKRALTLACDEDLVHDYLLAVYYGNVDQFWFDLRKRGYQSSPVPIEKEAEIKSSLCTAAMLSRPRNW